MANMFSGNTTKTAPKTLDECIRIDDVSKNLWTWAERLESLGKILLVIIIAIGLIATIATGVETSEYLEEIDRNELARAGITAPTVFDVVLESLLQWALYAFLEYCAYHILALLIGALASITQNTNISANVALYEATKNAGAFETSPTPKAIFSDKRTDSYNHIVNRTPVPADMWQCSNCGTHNKAQYGQCKKCGKFRS